MFVNAAMKKEEQWSRSYLQKMIDSQSITAADYHGNGSIVLSCFFKGMSQSMTTEKVLSPGTQEHSDFLELVAPFQRGETKYFWDCAAEGSTERTAEDVRYAIESCYYQKAELLPSGDLKLCKWSDVAKVWHEDHYRAETEQAKTILEITGPLKVGEVHEFKPSSD